MELSISSVTLYTAAECHLCEDALAVLRLVQDEVGFQLQVVDIGGDPVLEKRYRAWLPVVEVDGCRAFTYAVDPDELRDRLR